ncbi:MAG: S-layer homology domain-containing protein [Flavonifractor plautii]
MRNLKRTLSLVMAMALIVGMMVVSASAVSSDFNDSAEITNTEAVDVMTAIGVFEGTDKGAFNPTGILTREQAAKIVAVMLLGEEDASKLTTNSTTFKDVAANRWSAGYIGYCVRQGILAGTGNGNFDPEGELTGLAFAKMMLVALGYDAKVANYVGNDWAINVAADAVNAGIAPKGIVLADAMTREQAAQMAFQTLTADMVYYTNKGTTVNTPDGTQVVVGASAPVKVANSKTDDYRTVSADRDEVQQFCEKYFSDLSVNNNGGDDFGRPSEQWKNGSKEIGTYASNADASYTEEVKSKTIYSDLGLGETTKADVIVDGKTAADFTVKKGDDTKLEASGNGVLVEAFVDSDDNVTLVVINTYVGEVSKVVDADSVKKDEEPYIEIAGLTGNGGKFETNASFDEDDVVLYTVADGDIQTVTMAKKIEDQEVTSKTGDTKFVADGETYKYNKNHRTYDITLKSGCRYLYR